MSKYTRKTVDGVQCPRCDERLVSMYRHDFHYCGCGYTFVDGGRDYLRYGWGVKFPDGMWNDGTVPEEVWKDMEKQNKKIGKPKVIRVAISELPKWKLVSEEKYKQTRKKHELSCRH